MKNDTTMFQYCQKLIVFNEDFSAILLAKRKGEADYDGIYSFIGGKLETTDGGLVEGLNRKKNEEIGNKASLEVYMNATKNEYFIKANGTHMVLPHYIARHISGPIKINDEYQDFVWVELSELAVFEPKIETIVPAVNWAISILPTIKDESWTKI